VAELVLPLGLLERNPTLKAEMEEFGRRSVPVAFFTYPVMQVANILMPRAHLVPVGEDQLPHIELTREVARRFNRQFKEVFPEPEGLVGRVPRLVGIDGQAKMSKSLNNAIYLKDTPAVVNEKVRSMYTDPTRLRARIPATSKAIQCFCTTTCFNPNREEVADLKERYRRGSVGDVEVKQKLATALNAFLDPIRERRARFAAKMGLVRDAWPTARTAPERRPRPRWHWYTKPSTSGTSRSFADDRRGRDFRIKSPHELRPLQGKERPRGPAARLQLRAAHGVFPRRLLRDTRRGRGRAPGLHQGDRGVSRVQPLARQRSLHAAPGDALQGPRARGPLVPSRAALGRGLQGRHGGRRWSSNPLTRTSSSTSRWSR